MTAMEVPGGAVRSRYGVICLTPGHKKVALVRLADTGAWQFPSLLPSREGALELEEQLETALDVAQEQLGLDITACLCSQPVIHVSAGQKRGSCPVGMACCGVRLVCATCQLLRLAACLLGDCGILAAPRHHVMCRKWMKSWNVPSACTFCLLQALGPEPRASTKFFMAFNVPEVRRSGCCACQRCGWHASCPLHLPAAAAGADALQLASILWWAAPLHNGHVPAASADG